MHIRILNGQTLMQGVTCINVLRKKIGVFLDCRSAE